MLTPATESDRSPPPRTDGATPATTSVRVAAPGRLHLGFLDPSASLGRRFGSLGLVVDGPRTVIELGWAEPGASADVCSAAAHLAADHAAAELARARAHLAALRLALDDVAGPGSGTDGSAACSAGRSIGPDTSTGTSPVRPDLRHPLRLHLAEALPAHAGLGSGTQLGLAVGRAFCELHGIDLATAQIARITGRGLRSGVGITGFDVGGLLLDAGPPPAGGPAPLLSRLEMPADWRVLLVIDPGRRGLSGDAERAAIARLAPLPRERAAEICHEVVMRVLAGAASDDFGAFAAGLNRVQQVLGDHFAPAQDGSVYTSAPVARLMSWLAQQGTAGAPSDRSAQTDRGSAASCGGTQVSPCAVGQSSWGPTGFALFASQDRAEAALAAARRASQVDAGLQVAIVGARNHGAEVSRVTASHASGSSPPAEATAGSPAGGASPCTAPCAGDDTPARRLTQAA